MSLVRLVTATVQGFSFTDAAVLVAFVQSISVTVPVLNSIYCTPTSVASEISILATEPPNVAVVAVMAFASVVVTLGSPAVPKSISVPPAPVAKVISSKRIAEASKAVNLIYRFSGTCFNVKFAVAKTQ